MLERHLHLHRDNSTDNLPFEEVTFLWSQLYTTLSLSSEHLPNIFNVVAEAGAKYKDIIQMQET